MNRISRVKLVAALTLTCFSHAVFSDENSVQNSAQNDWSPYSFSSSFNSYGSSKIVPLYAESLENDFFMDKSDALSIGIEDASDGLWKFSLDLNQSQEALFSEERYKLNAAYSPNGDGSTFYINYGNRRVPVSIKVDDFLGANQSSYSGSDLSLGFDQKLNDSWAVSISYTKSELEQTSGNNNLLGFESSSVANQKYWFDLNRDGLPEAVNLFSELGVSSDFDKALEGIEIRLTRQVSEQLSIGGGVSQTHADFDWQPFQFNSLGAGGHELNENSLSLFSQLDFNPRWSLGAQLSHKNYQSKPSQIVSLVSDNSDRLNFDSTTLDIGVQYQGRWDDMGLVIRIDLVNLLGNHANSDKVQNYNDTGLAPYTFETPKYIKLSGSINF